MKEKPILFSGEMVRAILDGRKTQTRRILKQQPLPCEHHLGESWKDAPTEFYLSGDDWACRTCGNGIRLIPQSPGVRGFRCPYGKPGDRLWVREKFAYVSCEKYDAGFMKWGTHDIYPLEDYGAEGFNVRYAASETDVDWDSGWRPSIHMPRWASRITLEIINVRVERLNDISGNDIKAEGIDFEVRHFNLFGANAIEAARIKKISGEPKFRQLWEAINGPKSWQQNPWVWVIEFKKVSNAN